MNATNACPICQKQCKHRNHLRCHLHEEHQKFDIIDRYLEGGPSPQS